MLQRILSSEPAVFLSLLTAIVTFAVSVGLVSQAHADQLVSLAGAILPTLLVIINGFLIRARVTPVVAAPPAP